ncbi:hypothetical protein ZHAS_00004708 [Anopheles sinensis]|uniref:TEP1-F n=1 Tax=Anopheles sinensis TaxID=74873 RepID=A0A084VHP3_ANOSI|nr:hypothetical protein ZHAS_00004708 [Anopheles sinensis]
MKWSVLVPEKLADGEYMISIDGHRGFAFHEDVPVVIESERFSGLIQLDKPVYVPGDTVNFRVIVVDSDLKPPKRKYITVTIITPSDALLRQWDAAPLNIGVFEGSFQISALSIFGTYKIVVESNGDRLVSKTFEVKEYVLPGFDVDVFPTRVPLEKHQAVDLTVVAKNVFGKPIEFHDGSPATNVKCIVQVEGTEENEFERVSDNNGEILLQLTPSESEDVITLTVLVDGQEILEEEISKAEFKTKSFLKISLKSRAQVNMPIRLNINCDKSVTFFMYYVMAKGNIIDQGYVSVTRRTSANIYVQYSASMVPKATVFVVTVAGDRMVYDTMDILFEEQVNNIHVDIQQKQVQPGGHVNLNVRGRQGSYVALAAYDKRLREYGSIHDLTWKDVEMLYEHFYSIEEDEYAEFDIFEGFGLFARLPTNIKINSVVRRADRYDSFANPIQYRNDFAESFLWKNLSLQHSDQITLVERIPDTMTTWYLTGFAVHPEYGFGIVKQPVEFTTKKSFYIVDHLPYSIKRGEVVELSFTIFSNHKDSAVQVRLFNIHQQLEFIEQPFNDSAKIKYVVTQQKFGAPVTFKVKAKKLGPIVVRVEASYLLENDTIVKVIRVIPESLMKRGSESLMFHSQSYVNQIFEFDLHIDHHADVGSTKIQFIIKPNLLEAIEDNLQNITSTMGFEVSNTLIDFASNVAVLDFVTVAAKKYPEYQKLGRQSGLTSGYRNLLRYRKFDGSFNAYGSGDSSIFVTAFVVDVLLVASRYLGEVEERPIQSFDWLASKQHSSGRFEEIGPIVVQELQADPINCIALTSYVLIAFLNFEPIRNNYSEVIQKGIDYILNHRNDNGDTFHLAIVTYALTLHDPKSDAAVNSLLKLMEKGHMSEEHMYWPSESHTIATTAYALLSMRYNENFFVNQILTMRWLVKQRYTYDSFPRALDTYVGLKALTGLAEMIASYHNDYDIVFTILHNKSFRIRSFLINSYKNSYTGKFEDIPSDTRRVKINFAGKGVGLFTINYMYSVDLRNHIPQFMLTLEKFKTKSNYELKLKICANFIPSLLQERINVSLIEVTLPSGYVVDNHPISNATGVSSIEKIDIQYGATTVFVYYANMGPDPNCFTVTAFRELKASYRCPAYVIVKDFFHPEINAIKVYDVDQDDD